MMDSLELLLQCSTDSALYGLRNASVTVRRISRNQDVQKEMQSLQFLLGEELKQRANADGPSTA